jgi:putative ABC transport system ATP-binding protein
LEREEIMGYIEFNNVKKIYKMGDVKIKALSGVNFTIEQGEFAVIAGPSGAGKSTILNLLGGMDTCTTGEIIVDGNHINEYTSKQLTSYRRFDIGFVFQFYNLVQNLTVKENVELATQISKNPLDIDEIIESVGLSERSNNFPSQLSGGEQQRVAIARALAKNPKILLCDEPTGALDYATGKSILQLLQDTCSKRGVTVVVITHNLALTQMGNKIIKVKNGIISDITINENPLPIERIEW